MELEGFMGIGHNFVSMYRLQLPPIVQHRVSGAKTESYLFSWFGRTEFA